MSFFNQQTARLIPEPRQDWAFDTRAIKPLLRRERTRDLMKGAIVFTLMTGKPVHFDKPRVSPKSLGVRRANSSAKAVSVDLSGLL